MLTSDDGLEDNVFSVETSICMGIMLIAIMQFICAGFSIEEKISKYIDKKIEVQEMEYGKNDKVKKSYTPAEVKKCISIIENIGGEMYEY